MKSGKCPKCGSGDIYVSKPPSNFHLEQSKYGNAVYIKGNAIFTSHARLIHYACASCNYIESYIFDDESMQNIKEKWTPISQFKKGKEKRKRKNDEG